MVANSRKFEKLRKRSSLVNFVNNGIKMGRTPVFDGKGVKRAFLAQENFCVEFEDGSWVRVESKRDRNHVYNQCLRHKN